MDKNIEVLKESKVETPDRTNGSYQGQSKVSRERKIFNGQVSAVMNSNLNGQVQLKDKVQRIVNSSNQDLQLQVDTCCDFIYGIDEWQDMNQTAINRLESAVEQAISEQSFGDFHRSMHEHWASFESAVAKSKLILDNQKNEIAGHIGLIISMQEKLGAPTAQKKSASQLNGGFHNSVANMRPRAELFKK